MLVRREESVSTYSFTMKRNYLQDEDAEAEDEEEPAKIDSYVNVKL